MGGAYIFLLKKGKEKKKGFERQEKKMNKMQKEVFQCLGKKIRLQNVLDIPPLTL